MITKERQGEKKNEHQQQITQPVMTALWGVLKADHRLIS